MEFNQQYQDTIEKFRAFMQQSARDENWQFQLFTVPFANTRPERKYFKYGNLDSSSPEESLEKFEYAIQLHGNTGQQFFIIRALSNAKDSTPVDFAIMNPYFNPQLFKGRFSQPGINGMNQQPQMQTGYFESMLQMQQIHFQEMSEIRDELRNEKEERKLERLEGIIAAIQEEKATTMDKIVGFAESTTGQQIINGIMSMVQNAQNAQLGAIQNFQAPGNEMHLTREKSPSLDNSETEQQGTPQQDHQEQIQSTMNIAVSKLANVFNNDTLNVLYDLAIYCEQNPIVAKQLREQIRPKQTENEQ